jgi:hypothetical protein
MRISADYLIQKFQITTLVIEFISQSSQSEEELPI